MNSKALPPKLINVVLAEDHPRVRKAIRRMLDRSPDILVVGEAGDGQEALEIASDLSPHVLLLDVAMPRLNGMQVAQLLKQKDSSVRILVLSSFHDKQMVKGMLACGVSGYLTKEEAPEVLRKAVRSVAREQGIWLSRKVAREISSQSSHESPTDQSEK